MTRYDERLVGQLIDAAGTLATVSDQASVVLSSEFEDMVRPQVEAVRAILAQLPPSQTQWDGELHEDDLEVKVIASPNDTVSFGKVGVHIIHRPTGIGRQSTSKRDRQGNHDVALRALKGAVAQEYSSRGN